MQFDVAVPSDQRHIAVHGQDDAFAYLKRQWMDEREANRQVCVDSSGSCIHWS